MPSRQSLPSNITLLFATHWLEINPQQLVLQAVVRFSLALFWFLDSSILPSSWLYT
nr:MAG TPA: hypothetical protein [Bacteriophage sp.]